MADRDVKSPADLLTLEGLREETLRAHRESKAAPEPGQRGSAKYPSPDNDTKSKRRRREREERARDLKRTREELRKKLAEERPAGGRAAAKVNQPDNIAEMAVARADPFQSLAAAAEACGLDPKVAYRIVERLQTRYVGANATIKEFSTKALIHEIEKKISKSLDYMDDIAFSDASLRDLAVAFSILTEKRQMLLGEPTHIISVKERSELRELMPIILREAQRRGIVIDATVTGDGPKTIASPLSPEEVRARFEREATPVKIKEANKAKEEGRAITPVGEEL